MAYSGTVSHRKIKRLANLLGIRPCFALGAMEALWHLASSQRIPNGDLTSLTPLDISEEILYGDDPAEAERLVKAMVAARLLDTDIPGVRLYVHDFQDWATDAVHMRLGRHGHRFANGAVPNLSRFSKAQREKIEELFAEGGPVEPVVRTPSAQAAHEERIDAHYQDQNHNQYLNQNQNQNQNQYHGLPERIRAFWEGALRHGDPLFVAASAAALNVEKFRQNAPAGPQTLEAILAAARAYAPGDIAIMEQIALFEAYWLGQEKVKGKGYWWTHLSTWFDNCRKDWAANSIESPEPEMTPEQIEVDRRKRRELLDL